MSSNRLVPWQFGPGVSADATRIEQCVRELVELYDDVPAEFVQRRWSPSTLVWGFTPPRLAATVAHESWFLRCVNNGLLADSTLQPPGGVYSNRQRVKSSSVPELTPEFNSAHDLLTWETAIAVSRPCVIGAAWVFAERQAAVYTNNWQYAAGAPAPHAPGDPVTDFTLQCCVSDGWDLENRRKLRQEALLWRMRSDAFLFSNLGLPGVNLASPAHPTGNFLGFALTPQPLVLVPAGARVFWQWTVPLWSPTNATTWGQRPARDNVWTLGAQVHEMTR